MNELIAKFSLISLEWNRQMIHDEIKNIATAHNMKLPKIAMPLRVMVTGETKTPSIDLVLELLGNTETIARMNSQISNFPT
jgi:glutamyl-tRNA synthetase